MKYLRIAILLASVIAATAACAKSPKAELTNFKYRTDQEAPGRIVRLSIVGTIINKTANNLTASVCVRWYDAKGVEIHRNFSDEVKLKPRQSDSVTYTGYQRAEDWARTVLLKAFVSHPVFCDSPGEAISPVVELKVKNTTQ